MMMRTALAAVAAVSALTAGLVPAARGDPVTTVWLAPGGTGNGLTQSTPAGSLDQAEATLTQVAPAGPALVLLAAGNYAEAGTVTWTIPDTTMQPVSYDGSGSWGSVGDGGGYPVIDGHCASPGYLLLIHATGVHLNYLQFRNRLQTLVEAGPGADGLVVYGDSFTRAGTAWCPGPGIGYAGLGIYASQHWQVTNSHFTWLVNPHVTSYGGPGQIHGIYANQASYGVVSANDFSYISGDAVRVRNAADHNVISGNTFTRAGGNGYVGDWHAAGESASTANTGSGNHWHGYYGLVSPNRVNFCYDNYPAFTCAPARLLVTGS